MDRGRICSRLRTTADGRFEVVEGCVGEAVDYERGVRREVEVAD